MSKQNNSRNHDGVSQESHRCSYRCLGPLTFHPQAVGDKVCLSHGHRRAERSKDTFRNGLVFSSRPVKIEEKLRVRVEKEMLSWQGSLRVGFTNVSPSGRSLPLPSVAIPDLTHTPGHWAVAVPESLCQPGSELQFWVSAGGNIHIMVDNSVWLKFPGGVDLRNRLWAMIDIYGQVCSISLLGSKKRGLISRRSCPAPELLPDCDSLVPDVSGVDGDSDEDTVLRDTELSEENSCVVCLTKKPRVTLPCGHRCLCSYCSTRVTQQFGTCPLCRHKLATQHRFCSGLSGVQDYRQKSNDCLTLA